MPSIDLNRAASLLASRIDKLARVSDERGATTRTFLSPAMRKANAQVAKWMRQAGLEVSEDTVGNLIGRKPGGKAAKTLLIGSHLDTVRDAGRFDGILGVLIPIAALEVLRARGIELPFSVEVLGFSEEEGVRFSSAYLGSKGYTGTLRASDVRLRDAKGVSVEDALAALNGRKLALPKSTHGAAELLGYLEVHIEQGPVLEAKGLAAGVVSAIAGQTRSKIFFKGKAGHAGTTPMDMRKDALAAAAEFILAAETLASKSKPLVATVGRIAAYPGAANVIPGSVEFSLDVRHPLDGKRLSALRKLNAIGKGTARKRGLTFSSEVTQDNKAVTCSRELSAALGKSVAKVQGRSFVLPSGAGHDAVILSRLTPVSMLFVRCREGLSHHPDEHVEPKDLGTALEILVDFLIRMAQAGK
ncbi:MAG TPA: allantoate amidohydrolase [Opitutaceae bacterium]|jgi:allantoate deiminase|nr:allantoate amidohydrolase [Opitutaceae bacterium]